MSRMTLAMCVGVGTLASGLGLAQANLWCPLTATDLAAARGGACYVADTPGNCPNEQSSCTAFGCTTVNGEFRCALGYTNPPSSQQWIQTQDTYAKVKSAGAGVKGLDSKDSEEIYCLVKYTCTGCDEEYDDEGDSLGWKCQTLENNDGDPIQSGEKQKRTEETPTGSECKGKGM